MTERPIKPLNRWTGGKARHAEKHLLPHFRLGCDSYAEDFVGMGGMLAAALFHGVLRPGGRLHLHDLPGVVELWRAVYQQPRELLCTAAALTFEEAKTTPDEPASILVIPRLAWSGLYRRNRKGECNSPRASDRAALDVARMTREVLQWHALLQNFDVRFGLAPPGSVEQRYADPPYDESGFQYGPRPFDDVSQALLADRLHDCARRGERVIASNARTPFIEGLYPNDVWSAHGWERSNGTSCKASTRSQKRPEVVFTAGALS